MDENKKRKVLHITAVPMTGALLVSPIARRQADSGYDVEFACSPGEYLDKLQKLGFPVTLVPIERRLVSWSHLVALYRLWRLMRKQRYDVVHTHTPVASLLGRIAATLAGVPIVIYHMRVSWWESPDAGFLKRAGFTFIEWIAANLFKTDHIFTINSSDTKHLIAKHIVPAGQVTCLHSGAGGVDIRRFDPESISADQQENLRTEFGFKDTDFVVGFVGRFVHRKGVIELITAFRNCLDEVQSAKLLLVGDTLASERDQSTLEFAKKMVSRQDKLARNVVFTGFRDDIPGLISIMDVVVMPSRLEPFGMVMAEAASMAKPIISTDTQGGREAVIPGESGLIVPIGDILALQKAIFALAHNPALRKQMGETGRCLARTRFDEKIVFEKIKSVYDNLFSEKGLC